MMLWEPSSYQWIRFSGRSLQFCEWLPWSHRLSPNHLLSHSNLHLSKTRWRTSRIFLMRSGQPCISQTVKLRGIQEKYVNRETTKKFLAQWKAPWLSYLSQKNNSQRKLWSTIAWLKYVDDLSFSPFFSVKICPSVSVHVLIRNLI